MRATIILAEGGLDQQTALWIGAAVLVVIAIGNLLEAIERIRKWLKGPEPIPVAPVNAPLYPPDSEDRPVRRGDHDRLDQEIGKVWREIERLKRQANLSERGVAALMGNVTLLRREIELTTGRTTMRIPLPKEGDAEGEG